MPSPDLSAIAAARGDLAAADAGRRDLDVQAAALAAKRAELLGRGIAGQPLVEVEAQLAKVGELRAAGDAARSTITGRLADLSDGLVGLLGSPDAAVETLDGSTPVALLPVRIEARFADGGKTLHVRVFPDQIHVDASDPALTADEVTAGSTYWSLRWPAMDDASVAAEAWAAMCAGFRPGRARYVVDRMRPTNTPADGQPTFPSVELRSTGWSRAATATALPDRILVVGYRRIAEGSYEELFRAWGGGVPDRLQVGLSPEPGKPSTPGGLPVDPGLDWLRDPKEARAAGMLITITDANLAGGRHLADGIDRLVAVGVDWTVSPSAAAAVIEALAGAQQAEGQLAFVPQGTPTNNTSGTRSGWSTDRSGLVAALDPAAAPPAFDAWSAGRRLASALGVGPDLFDGVPGADLREQRVQASLADALWRVTGGYYLVEMLDPLARDPAVDADLREHVAGHLFAGGPLPTLQVGPQPYGMLPVVARRRYEADPASRAESAILRVATVLRELVEPLVDDVPHLRRAGEAQAVDTILLALLLRTPVPWEMRYRGAVGPVEVKAMSVYWDKIAAFQRDWTSLVWSRLHTYTVTRLSELTLDKDDHPLDVPLVRKSGAAGDPTAYLAEIRHLLADPNGRLALNVRQDSEALLEALVACAAVRELDRVAAAKARDAVTTSRPELLPALEMATTLNVAAPDTLRVVAEPEALPFSFASPRQLAEAVLPEVHASQPLAEVTAREFAMRLPDIVALLGAPTDPLYWLGRFSVALDDLGAVPPDQLEWAFRGHLDLFSARLDAWWTSLADRRLAAHRATRPSGVHIGCWGWIEDLRPDPAGSDSLGYVHAPSLAHATTAAILRSGRQAHQDESGALFDIEITSARTRDALALLRGVAQGQRIAALLGYRLERRLQDRDPRLARYIWELRRIAPMRSDEAPLDTTAETIAAHDVVDALTLLDRWKDDRAGTLAAANVAAGDQDAVAAILDDVAGLYDGVGDLLVAEAVHQVAQENLERAGAAMAAHDRQAAAPDPDFVRTPRPGHTVTLRAGILLQDLAAAPGWPADARSSAEPRLDAWLGAVLGSPATFGVTGRLVRADGTIEPLDPVPLAALGLGATSVAIAARRPAQGRPSELEARFALAFAGQVHDAGPDDRIELLADGPAGNEARGLGLLQALAGWAAGFLSAPALSGAELRGADDMPGAGDGSQRPASPDLAELAARATAVAAALDAAAAGLDVAIAAAAADGLATALLAAGPFDADAIPVVPAGHADAAVALLDQAQAVRARLGTASTAAATTLALPPDADSTAQAGRLGELIRSILGAAQPVLPAVLLADPLPTAASLADAAALTGGDPLAPLAWLHQHALVRPALDPFASLLLHAEADGADVAGAMRIVQSPHRPGSRWVGLPFGEGGPPPHGTAALVAHGPGSIDPTKAIAGLVVDSWTETIPATRETTAVSFHYDAPGARAPQAVVLGVHPAVHPGTWDLPTLLDTVNEAADLARLRTLAAKELAPLGGFLPALYLPNDYTRDVPSVPIKDMLMRAEAVGTVQLALKSVLGKG